MTSTLSPINVTHFFTNIGPTLASKINVEGIQSYAGYLKHPCCNTFSFKPIDASTTIRELDMCVIKMLYYRPTGNTPKDSLRGLISQIIPDTFDKILANMNINKRCLKIL